MKSPYMLGLALLLCGCSDKSDTAYEPNHAATNKIDYGDSALNSPITAPQQTRRPHPAAA